MLDFIKLLSNREVSLLIWTLVLFGILIATSKISFRQVFIVLKLLLSKYLLLSYLLAVIYFYFIIDLLKNIGVWEYKLYKDFFFWALMTGAVMFFRVNKLNTNKDFISIILSIISVTAIFEFVLGFYNFSLLVELIVIPLVTLISLLSYFAGKNRDHHLVSRLLDNLLSVFGLGMLAFVIYKIFNSHQLFFTESNLKSFLLPPVFTLLFIPIIFLFVLCIKYEEVFSRLNRYQFITKRRRNLIKYYILLYSNCMLKRIATSKDIILFKKKELEEEVSIRRFLKREIRHKES